MALTLRPTPEFNDHLDSLKNRLNISTGTGVIKFVVENYAEKEDELRETRRELDRVKYQFEQLIEIERKKKAVEQELANFLEQSSPLKN